MAQWQRQSRTVDQEVAGSTPGLGAAKYLHRSSCLHLVPLSPAMISFVITGKLKADELTARMETNERCIRIDPHSCI